MKVPKYQEYPKTEEEARQLAIDWQNWQSDKSLSMGIIAEWGAFFKEMANRFPDLKDEFVENAII